MPKIVNTALKAKAKATGPEAKAKAIKFGLEAPRGQGLASRTTSLLYTYTDLVRAHASTSYSKLDIHVQFINCKITSSDTMRPIFPNIAFAER